MRRLKQIVVQLAVFAVAFVIAVPTTLVLAACPNGEQSCSTNFRVDQTFFGSGGELEACSTGATGYCAKQTAGELTVGNTKGTLYQAYAGFNTTDVPFIEFVATAGSTDLGVLNTSTTATTTGSFYVRAWQAGGYVVTASSDPPKNGGYTMATPGSPTASAPGTEQFGINLIRNTDFCGTGCHLGDNPQQVPDGTFSFGAVDADYNQPNLFMYAKGDTIARSTQSTSVTIYTISYIFNIRATTAGGTFTYNQNIVATGTY